MLLNARGAPMLPSFALPPTPSESLERTLRDVLRHLDELLDVRWMPTGYWNSTWSYWEGRYALTCRWPHEDKRWELVRDNRMPATDAFDIIGWLCEDMTDAQSVPTSYDGITDRVVALLGRIDNTRFPIKSRMLSIIDKNRARHAAVKADVADMTHDAADYYYRQVMGAPLGIGANFTNTETKQ